MHCKVYVACTFYRFIVGTGMCRRCCCFALQSLSFPSPPYYWAAGGGGGGGAMMNGLEMDGGRRAGKTKGRKKFGFHHSSQKEI